jgi:dolichyl-phosphate-mannose--protein O-mannosyl transferase
MGYSQFMDSLRSSLHSRSVLVLAVLAGLVSLLGIVARFYHLGFPAAQVFDEVYFPVFANQYLNGINVFDVHPPLGKFIIAASIYFFGDTSFAWRLMPALFGVGIIGVGFGIGRYFLKSWIAAFILVIFFSLETMLVTYSRTGLMDGIHLFFILATFLGGAMATKRRHMVGVAVLLGFAVSIKWVAAAVIIPMGYVMWRKGMLKVYIPTLWISFAVYLLFVYWGQYLNGVENPWEGVSEWHSQAFGYHRNLTATHPWSSEWWSWPLMLRPVLFFYELQDSVKPMIISAIGNPVAWWASTLAVVVSAAEVLALVASKQKIKDHPLVPLLLGYVAFLVPWVAIDRVVFIYHYLPSYAFALLMLAYWLARWWKGYQWAVLAFVVLTVASGIFYLPMAMALPMTQENLQLHLWLKSWL